MVVVPDEFLDKLKAEFTASREFAGYDPDEDPGYFIDWLVGKLYEQHRAAPPGAI